MQRNNKIPFAWTKTEFVDYIATAKKKTRHFPFLLLYWNMTQSSGLASVALVAIGAAAGTFFTLAILERKRRPALDQAEDCRRLLPKTVIILRHGESEANKDKSMWKKIPDNLLGLTETGRAQAKRAGERVEAILAASGCQRVHIVVSPFERTLQTSAAMRPAFEHRIVRTDIESRIREQEVGNLQNDDFQKFRTEQQKVGRFWYRFPTGESGADVLDRVKSWWYESVVTVNTRVGYDPIDALVVVTHGLTLRFILMQLFGWSPTTFHSVWNANNCGMYVLRKDLSKPGPSPFLLDAESGDMPQSSIDVLVEQENGETALLKLEDYLSIPPPRTTHLKLVKHLLARQYPEKIESANDITRITFMPFVEGGVVKGRSTSGVHRSNSTLSYDSDEDCARDYGRTMHAEKETSFRFPCIVHCNKKFIG